jgi:hypothetical protein
MGEAVDEPRALDGEHGHWRRDARRDRLPVPLLFEDGFESEDLCEWTAQSGGPGC